MSKQNDAKLKQGYVPKAVPNWCSNCAHFSSTKEAIGLYVHETNLRCGIGGFKVMKMGTCNEWTNKTNA